MSKISFQIKSSELSESFKKSDIKSITVIFSSHGWFELHDTKKRNFILNHEECWKEIKTGNLVRREPDDSSMLANGNKLAFNIDIDNETNRDLKNIARGLVIAYFNWNDDFFIENPD